TGLFAAARTRPPISKVAKPKARRHNPAPAPVTVDGAVAEASPAVSAAAATTTSNTPSSRNDRLASVVASGKKCTPTPNQIHTPIPRYCPTAPKTPATAPSSPNPKPTMMLYRRLATGSAITRNRPADRLVTTTPATVSSTPRPVPTASGTTSHDGAAA